MKIKRISIKFCGGCNPRINRGCIAAEVTKWFAGNGYEIVYNSLEADFIVYLSGCTASCARRYSERETPCVVIAAATVDSTAIEESEIGPQIIGKVRGYFEQLEKLVSP